FSAAPSARSCSRSSRSCPPGTETWSSSPRGPRARRSMPTASTTSAPTSLSISATRRRRRRLSSGRRGARRRSSTSTSDSGSTRSSCRSVARSSDSPQPRRTFPEMSQETLRRSTETRGTLGPMAETASALSPGTVRVLVVDDEPSITDAVATALRYEGFETMEVGAGRAAELAIDEFRPDLIVLDVMLPDLDGFAIARRLRDGNHRVPVIFLTAKDATEDKVAGLALADDYVTKPFSLAEI